MCAASSENRILIRVPPPSLPSALAILAIVAHPAWPALGNFRLVIALPALLPVPLSSQLLDPACLLCPCCCCGLVACPSRRRRPALRPTRSVMAAFVAPFGQTASLRRQLRLVLPRTGVSPRMGAVRPAVPSPPSPASPTFISRRAALAGLAAVSAAAAGFAATGGRPDPAAAAMYPVDARGDLWAPKGDLTRVEAYLPQLRAGAQTLQSLQERWDTLVTNGDDVRRELGTVGLKSPLLNIRKTFEAASRAASAAGADPEVLDALDDGVDEITSGIGAVDFQVYSIGFTELEPTKRGLAEKSKEKLDEVVTRYARVLQLFEGLTK